MRGRDLLTKKLQLFYQDIQLKRNKKGKMRLQVDLEFEKNDIKELNKKYNVEMFSNKVRGGKAFAAEQKIRKLKQRASKLNLIKSKSKNPHQLLKMSAENMNKIYKYSISADDVEKHSLSSENFRLGFNFDQIKTVEKAHNALDKYDAKIYSRKKKKLRENLVIGDLYYYWPRG